MRLFKGNEIAVLLIVSLIYRASMNVIQTNIPLYAKYYLHANDFVVSSIVTIATASSFVAVVYSGIGIRNHSKAILASLVILCEGIPFLILTSNIALLILVVLALYFANGLLAIFLITRLVLTSLTSQRERNVKLFTAALSLGLLLGPLLQGAFLLITGSNLLFSMILFAPLLLLAIILFAGSKTDSLKKIETGRRLDFSFVKNRIFLQGVLINGCFSLPFAMIVTFGGILAKARFETSYLYIQLLFSIFFATSFLVRILLVRVSFRKFVVSTASIALTISGMAIVFYSRNYYELSLALVLLGCAHGAIYPTSANYIADGVSSDRLAAANSLSSILTDLSASASLPIFGSIAQSLGVDYAFLAVEPVVVAIAFIYIAVSQRVKKRIPTDIR